MQAKGMVMDLVYAFKTHSNSDIALACIDLVAAPEGCLSDKASLAALATALVEAIDFGSSVLARLGTD